MTTPVTSTAVAAAAEVLRRLPIGGGTGWAERNARAALDAALPLLAEPPTVAQARPVACPGRDDDTGLRCMKARGHEGLHRVEIEWGAPDA